MTLNEIVRVIAIAPDIEDSSIEYPRIGNNYQTKLKNIGTYINEIIDLISDPIYVKKAVGQYGKPINVYKFRTMRKDADKQLAELLHNKDNIDYQGKIKNDNRITKIGTGMRKTHLDELPQIYNLLIGDLKPIGIRPMEQVVWDTVYPENMYQEAIKHKFGWWGVNYALSKKRSAKSKDALHTHKAFLRLYQQKYKKDPIKTDIVYFSQGVYNKLRGQCSS